MVTDGEGLIVSVNTAWVDLFLGETQKDIAQKNEPLSPSLAVVGQSISEWIDGQNDNNAEGANPQTPFFLQQSLMNHPHQQPSHSYHLMARRLDGTEFPCRVRVTTLDKDLYSCVIQDSTKEQEALCLAVEQTAAQQLLFNMLPQEIAQRLIDKDPQNGNDSAPHIADHFGQATILFADIVGFTQRSTQASPVQVVTMLNSIFSRFDQQLDKYGLNKVKTIGDCYMVTTIPSDEHGSSTNPHKKCAAVCHFAMDMLKCIKDYNQDEEKQFSSSQEHEAWTPLTMRIGINTGPVVAGVVGTKRFLYDVLGDAVNVASRMESTGVPGKVQVTKAVVDSILQHDQQQHRRQSNNEFVFERRGMVPVKGIGEMETYFIQERDGSKQVNYHWGLLRSSVLGAKRQHERQQRQTFQILKVLKQLEELNGSRAITTNTTSRGRTKQQQQQEEGGGGVGEDTARTESVSTISIDSVEG